MKRRQLCMGAMSIAGLGLASASDAQQIDGTGRWIVGATPGGGLDGVARALAGRMQDFYSGGLIVLNRPGAAARLAVAALHQSPPDGSTLLLATDFTVTVFPHSYKSLGFRVAELQPVTLVARTSFAVSAGPAVPSSVTNIAQFIAWAKTHPREVSFASTSLGSSTHFIGVMLAKAANLDLVHVPYKGGAPAIQDLLGGQVSISINPIAEVLPHIGSGRVRVLATTGAEPSQFLPNIPTLVQSGLRDVVAETWVAFFTRENTPPKATAAVSRRINELLQSYDVANTLAGFGMVPQGSTAAELGAMIERDSSRWAAVIKASGFQAMD